MQSAIFLLAYRNLEFTTIVYANFWYLLLSHKSFKNAYPNPNPNPNSNPNPSYSNPNLKPYYTITFTLILVSSAYTVFNDCDFSF